MAARDELEGEIDGKMVALFNRLKQLEDANLNLEQVRWLPWSHYRREKL